MQVDFLASDATHARNVWALERLRHIAAEACRGAALPPLPLVTAVHGSGGVPVEAPSAPPPPFAALDPSLDASQLAAAAAALDPTRPLVAVQGPPGTGKTGVVIEVARQAAARGQRLLVCAPSNLAVDNLTLRLARADPSLRLVRVGNPERVDAAALALTPAAAAAAREIRMRQEAAAEEARLLREVERNPEMKPQRKEQMRSFYKRHMRRLLEKRVARGEMVTPLSSSTHKRPRAAPGARAGCPACTI